MNKKKTRQLAAVMFADIVGYTALMQENEKKAIDVRERHRQAFQEQHKLHNGTIVQYYGDGVLSVFTSAIEAVKCAIEIQLLLQQGTPLPVRIGLHTGDIVYNQTEVYGDGVNFASRIESMGIPGAILLSGKLNDELKNQPSILTTSLGFYELKNISDPVEIFAVTNNGIIVPQPIELKGKQKTVDKTIAVLPFVNMSGNEEMEYFSDGITEEIINALAKIEYLKVTSRTSSFYFKNKHVPVTQIAKELNVNAVLEGSVRLGGKQIRITAQLIHAEEDFHFWSETWDRKLENIFEVQDEVSLHIAEKLREQYGHFEIQDHLVDKKTENLDAYEYSLKARYLCNKWNPSDVKISIDLYEKALQLDAEHTDSLVGLADAYGFMASTELIPPVEGWQKVRDFTNKAFKLNPEHAGVHYQLANLAFFQDANFNDAFTHAQKAIELKPNYPEAHQFVSFLYMISGEMKKAKHHLETALSIDPLSQETLFYKAYFHYRSEDYNNALELYNKILKNNPKNIPAHIVKNYCLLQLGQYDEVLQNMEEMPKELVVPDERLGITCLAYILKKDDAETQKYMKRLQLKSEIESSFQAHSYKYLAYANMGKSNEAFDWLKKVIGLKSPIILLSFSDPLANNLKRNKLYKEFSKQLYGKPLELSGKNASKISLLDDETATIYANKLVRFIDEEEPFLIPNLSLRSLADQVEIHPNKLSWLLNEKVGKNFNEFVNHYRIEYFKKLAVNPENSHISLIGLAYESGFNSKTVFNSYFKKEVGMTPKEFLKQNK